jgi:lactoylglutathione lyase
MGPRRALHWVFKIGDRKQTIDFYTRILGMKVLRHEEFESGCDAACNGPYDNKWSKTMVGFGPEDDHFVAELTYNYPIASYTVGNDFLGLVIESSKALNAVKTEDLPRKANDDQVTVKAPGDYPIVLRMGSEKVTKCRLASSNIAASVAFWGDVLGMKVYEKTCKRVVMGYGDDQCHLELIPINIPLRHEKALGRIAFSCPAEELPDIEARVKAVAGTILKPLVKLSTPGKADVEVVILADPDGYEICFVGDEAFRELSAVDPNAQQLLNKAIEEDKSHDWFEKKGLSKPQEL